MKSISLGSLLILGCLCCQIEGFLAPATPAKGRNCASRATTGGMASSPKKAKTSDEDVPAALLEHAVAWSATNGLGMVVKDDKGLFTSTHLPFSLLPYGEVLAGFLQQQEL